MTDNSLNLSQVIRKRLTDADKRYWAGDNISEFITDKEKTIGQVIKGYTGEMVVNGKKYNSTMPAQQLNDDEVAAVLTYVYSNFGNGGTSVTAGEVTAARAKLQ